MRPGRTLALVGCGGFLLAPGDRVVCRIPNDWLAVTLPDAGDIVASVRERLGVTV